jgi:tetratricopeptide (TPR) repeat protein
VESLFTELADASWMTDWLATLVGLRGQQEALVGDRRGEGFAAWRGFLEAVAETRPLVLVFEDLHWADDALLDFIDELVEWASGVPLLVLCTARPELLERRPGWGGGKANALTMSLPPLAAEETARVIAAVLDRPVVAAETQEALLVRAGGNPLYAEQYARMLAERGELEGLPETVHSIIAARLDALSPQEKMLLQDAAVLGTVFWRGAVEARDRIAHERAGCLLQALERKEFVQRTRRSSVANESEYAFRHVLVRDVAYRQIPRAARAEKHRRVAAWIESLGRPEDHAELIAHHYLRALEFAQAAGQDFAALAELARRSLRDAGDRAASLGAHEASAWLYAAALNLWPGDDPERAQLLVSAGRAKVWADGTGIELIGEAFEALRAAGDADEAAEAAVELARCSWLRGDRDAAYTWVDEALELAGPKTGSRARAYALLARSAYHMLASEHPEALRLAQEALPLADALGIGELRARARDVIGSSKVFMGNADGLRDLEEAVSLARQAGAFYGLSQAYTNLRDAQLCLGRVEDASRTLEEFRQNIDRFGTADIRRWLRMLMLGDLFTSGRWDDALALADEEIAHAEAGSSHYAEPISRTLRASIRLARGDVAGASADAALAIQLARRTKDPQSLAPSLAMGARTLVAEGRRDEAGSLVSELFALGRTLVPGLQELIGGEPLVIFVWVTCDLGRTDELLATLEVAPRTPWVDAAIAIAGAEPARAADILERLWCRTGASYTRLRAAQAVRRRRRRRGEPDAKLAKAVTFYRQAGATAYLHEADALLATSTDPTGHDHKRRTSMNP